MTLELEILSAPLEVKFAEADAPGSFEGLASAFGVVDAHADMCLPGCFKASLAAHKAAGTMPIMYLNHGPAFPGGHTLPIGVWTHMEETAEGLFAKGQLLNVDLERGKEVRGLMVGGALSALSIGFRVPAGGASYNSKAKHGEARRLLKNVELFEVSPVARGSNPRAKVSHIKADAADAIRDIQAKIAAGEWPTQREFERGLRDVFGLSRSQAAAVADHGFKSLVAREREGEANEAAAKAAMDMRAALDGICFPTF
jgi:uncharacterized protein